MVLPFEGGTAAFVSERSAGGENGEADTEEDAGTDKDAQAGDGDSAGANKDAQAEDAESAGADAGTSEGETGESTGEEDAGKENGPEKKIRSGGGDWKAPEGYDYTLEQTEEGWTVTDPSGVTHGFDVFGLLKTI